MKPNITDIIFLDKDNNTKNVKIKKSQATQTKPLIKILEYLGLAPTNASNIKEELKDMRRISKKFRDGIDEILGKTIPLNIMIEDIIMKEHNSAIITKDNRIFVFGEYSYCNFGQQNFDDMFSTIEHPFEIKIPGAKFTQIATGKVTMLLTTIGTVYGCGFGTTGQLGSGHTDNVTKLTEIKMPDGAEIIEIAIGDLHTLFLTKNNEVLSCGDNKWGQLGSGDTKAQLVPKKIKLPNNAKAIKIAAGELHSVLLTDKGTVYTFGRNVECPPWLTDLDPKLIPEEIKIPNNTKIIDIATGNSHVILLDENGVVYTFGCNKYGQLGLKDLDNRSIPTEVTALKNKKITQIKAGDIYSFFLTDDGEIFACGNNEGGQLGFKDQINRLSPEKVIFPGEKKIRTMAAGSYNSLFLTKDEEIYGCGMNNDNALGVYSDYHDFTLEHIPLTHLKLVLNATKELNSINDLIGKELIIIKEQNLLLLKPLYKLELALIKLCEDQFNIKYPDIQETVQNIQQNTNVELNKFNGNDTENTKFNKPWFVDMPTLFEMITLAIDVLETYASQLQMYSTGVDITYTHQFRKIYNDINESNNPNQTINPQQRYQQILQKKEESDIEISKIPNPYVKAILTYYQEISSNGGLKTINSYAISVYNKNTTSNNKKRELDQKTQPPSKKFI